MAHTRGPHWDPTGLPKTTSIGDRRRRLINLMVLATAAASVLSVIAALFGVRAAGHGGRAAMVLLAYGAVAALLGALIVFLLNRFVSGDVAGVALVLIIVIISALSDTPLQVASGRGLLALGVPILAASFVLRPWASFPTAALASVVIAIVGLGPAGQPLPNIPAMIIFHIIALISWFSASNLEQTLRDLDASNALLREQAQGLEEVLAAVPAGVLVIDGEGRMLQANPVALEQLAILSEDPSEGPIARLGDRRLAELLAPETPGLWHELTGDGRVFEAIARPVSTPPAGGAWVLVITDVTRERQVADALHEQERMAALGQLAAGIAHDFNNIMASIVLYAQLVDQSPQLSDQNRSRMGVILDQAHHASRLIEQILDFSRRSLLKRQVLDLAALITEQVKLLRRTLPEHIRIETRIGAEPCLVHADPTRLRQVLTNLAVNARDAMPGGGTLTIGLSHVAVEPDDEAAGAGSPPGAWVAMAVSDTGTGIEPGALPHIFEPFFTTKEPGKGSGLGLSQVHGIVAQHGGHLKVDTVVGAGTTFTVYLPEMPQAPLARGAASSETMPLGHLETILVVEDNVTLRQALAEVLMQLNYRVQTAADGREALEMLRVHPEIAVVLSDLIMPEMGGRALFEAVSEADPHVPMVILTGHLMQEDLEELEAKGLAGWLLKPPDAAELSRLLARVLRGDEM